MNIVARHFATAVLPLFTLAASGCAVDASDATGELSSEDAVVGQTSQALTDWSAGSHASTDEPAGESLGVAGSSSCFLSGIAGNLGGTFDGSDGQYQARAGVGTTPFGAWRVYGHGGTTPQGAWLGNRVQARATCVPHPRVAVGTWSTNVDALAAPVRIANIDSGTRQCFLSNVLGHPVGVDSNPSMRVRRIVFPDATHPTPGFYVEATGYSTGLTRRQVTASCVDFPAGTQFESATISGPVTAYPVGSSLVGKKACALTEYYGTLLASSYTDGVLVKPPTTDTGAWTVTVAAGKRGTVLCAL